LAEVASQQTRQAREWRIMRDEFQDEYGRVNEQAFRIAVQEELAAFENVGHRLRRGLTAGPIYVEYVKGQFETIGWMFRDAFVPPAKTGQPPVEPAAEEYEVDLPEPEPAAEPQAA
jgi:hypothetical protein